MYIYDPDDLDGLLATVADDDSVTMTGKQFRELIEANAGSKKAKGRKPIELDDELFDRVVKRWQEGEMTARAAMQELDLKPNTFYRRVKERKENMSDFAKELKRLAKEEKRDMKDLKKQVKAEAKDVKEAASKASDTMSAHKMEREIHKEKLAAKSSYKKEMQDLAKTVEAEAEAIRAAEAEKEAEA